MAAVPSGPNLDSTPPLYQFKKNKKTTSNSTIFTFFLEIHTKATLLCPHAKKNKLTSFNTGIRLELSEINSDVQLAFESNDHRKTNAI
jgi:hypothetical protein